MGWPQQPRTEQVLNFNMIFHDPTPKALQRVLQNIKIELNDSEVLSSYFPFLRVSAASLAGH